MPAFPEGKATGYVSVLDFDQQDFNWSDENFEAPKKERLHVYELLVRDFCGHQKLQNYKRQFGLFGALGHHSHTIDAGARV
jgi:1,4-alpha-glucan branching enzyme